MTYGREDAGAPNYEKKVSDNHIPRLTSGQEVHNEISTSLSVLHSTEPYIRMIFI